ncbi:hypothetical protein MTW84_00755 [Mammaliicoccus sciuri]|uniref:hypothetical protein n=1 Tax=Mammaliicoccus sciuri TaxID=1296 RepID=UPI001FB2949D|nr:hypothetical protein [Mammaliicoccus sciuri]MCJ0907723.1 hypothetical protein [Mammaliicoccus sciuri]
MAYEYENTVVAELTSLGMQYNSNAHYEMAEEVEEVYAKAKAFNEIVGLRNNHYIYSKTNSGTTITVLDAKPFGREVSHLINKNKYMEDE